MIKSVLLGMADANCSLMLSSITGTTVIGLSSRPE